MAAFAKDTRGELDLNSNYTIKSSDIVEASISLANSVGATYKLSDINRFMITTSDNTATNIMIRAIGGISEVNKEIRRMGYFKTVLNRYMRIPQQIDARLENYISVHESADLIKNIYKGTLRDIDGETALSNYLNNNIHKLWLTNEAKYKASVYDKPGNDKIFGVENDVAIISKNGKAFVIVVLNHKNGGNGLTYTQRFSNLGSFVADLLQ